MKLSNKARFVAILSILLLSLSGCSEENLPLTSTIDTSGENHLFNVNSAVTTLNEIVYLVSEDGNTLNQKIYTINSDGSNQTLIGEDVGGGIMNFSLSPVDSRITFSRFLHVSHNFDEFNVFELDVESHSLTNITNFEEGLELAAHARPIYSNDGTKILFGMVQPQHLGVSDIFSMNLDTQELINLTNTNYVEENRPVTSPAGSKVVIQSLKEGRFGWQLYVMNLDGSNVVRVSDLIGNAQMPSWSPDGTRLVYTEGNSLFVVNADGTDRIRIVDVDEMEGSSWYGTFSPDGSKIAFDFHPNHPEGEFISAEIFTINPDGSDLQQITNTSAKNTKAQWSPDGTKLVFESEEYPDGVRGFMWNIKVINADGTNPVTLTTAERGGRGNYSPKWAR